MLDRCLPVFLAINRSQYIRGKILRLAIEHDLAGAQADNPFHVAFGQFDIVNVDNRRQCVFITQLTDQAHDLARRLRIQRGRRFIDQQQFWILDQRPGNSDPLALPAGQGIGALVEHVLQPDPIQQSKGVVEIALGELTKPAAPEAHIAESAR